MSLSKLEKNNRVSACKEDFKYAPLEMLVRASMAITNDYIAPHVGCRFLTVDSKLDAIRFYEQLGFVLLKTEENQENRNPLMLFDLNTAEE